MTFVEAFYSFRIDLTNVDSGQVGKFRVKTPRHPYEPLQHLYARVLALVHAWTPKTCFSAGMFAPDEPAIFEHDALQQYKRWIEVGALEKKKLHRAIRCSERLQTHTEFRVYFYQPEQIVEFCGELRGSKSNWIEPVSFFQLSEFTLTSLVPLERSSSEWTVTVIDGTMYLTVDGNELETSILPLDMWHEYQLSIDNQTRSEG